MEKEILLRHKVGLPILYVHGRNDPFYIITYYMKWVTTSWTDGIKREDSQNIQTIIVTRLYIDGWVGRYRGYCTV